MHKALTLAVLAGLLLHPSGVSPQIRKESTFDCGTISLSPSGRSMVYYDLGRGFRFEFPSDWIGRKIGLADPAGSSSIIVEALLAANDPRFYVSEGAKVTGAEAIKGLEWTALAWPDGRRGYYAYRDGVAIEFVAMGYGKRRAPSAAVLTTLTQILSSFSFVDDSFRLDRRLAALHAGQKLGSLTIDRIVPGTGGFSGTVGRIELAGRLTLTGNVHLESTMGGGRSGYFIDSFDSGSPQLIPQLGCPLYCTGSTPPGAVFFSNQDFAEQQFGEHAWYNGKATVVVDNISETFYNAGEGAHISARLIAVIDKKPIP
jgi:hypothetical protein